MNIWTLAFRNLYYYRRPKLLAVLGMAVGTAVITGALAVGDYLRTGLRERALARLGPVTHALVSEQLREELAAELNSAVAGSESVSFLPLLHLRGSAATELGRAVSANVTGINHEFARAFSAASAELPEYSGRRVLISQGLASELAVKPGDWLLLRLPRLQDAGGMSLFGRRDFAKNISGLRVQIAGYAPAGIADFSLQHDDPVPWNIFMDLAWLRAQLELDGTVVNTILAAFAGNAPESALSTEGLNGLLKERLRPNDFSLRLRPLETDGFQLESQSMVLPGTVPEAVRRTGAKHDIKVTEFSVYLANSLRLVGGSPVPGREISYSIIVAAAVPLPGVPELKSDEIALNSWAAEQLSARAGDSIALDFFVSRADGTLDVRTYKFRVQSILPMSSPMFDPKLVPEFRGITDSASIADWDPPFPIEMKRITQADEDYWDTYRTTPKALLTPARLRQLWSGERERPPGFAPAWITSIRLRPGADSAKSAGLADLLSKELAETALAPRFRDVRMEALRAAQGSTDFGGLFLGMSFFIILAALLVTAMLLRLHNETRIRENGLLLSLGFASARLKRLLAAEQAVIVAVGVCIGLPAGIAYARGLIWFLGRQWSAVYSAPLLLSSDSGLSVATMVAGVGGGLLLGLFVCLWSNRLLEQISVLQMLRGWRALARIRQAKTGRKAGLSRKLAAAGLGSAVLVTLPALTRILPAAAFFGAGALLLAGLLALTADFLRRGQTQAPAPAATAAGLNRNYLALRTICRQSGRSLLVIAVIACTSFILVTTAAQRRNPRLLDHEYPGSGTGGYKLILESAVPLAQPLPAVAAQILGGDDAFAQTPLAEARIISCRRSGGDDISCLNIQRPAVPRVLGLPADFIRHGGFSFSRLQQPASGTIPENPWLRLQEKTDDGSIPCFVDAASAQWILQKRLGEIVVIPGRGGSEARLRIIGLLQPGIFAGDLLVAEEHFLDIFSDRAGYSFFLIDAPASLIPQVQGQALELFSETAMNAVTASVLLQKFANVQNTYISTFLVLGGIGLLLGAAALLIMLLRQLHERRAELAQMQALGFSGREVAGQLLFENAVLLLTGLLIGTSSSLLATAPQLADGATEINWLSLSLTLAGIPLVLLALAWLTVARGCRHGFLAALRAE